MNTYFTIKTWTEYFIPAIIGAIVIIVILLLTGYVFIEEKIKKIYVRKAIESLKKKGFSLKLAKYCGLSRTYLVKDVDIDRYKLIDVNDLKKSSVSDIKRIAETEEGKIEYKNERYIKFVDEEE